MVKVMLARGSSGLQVEVLQKALAHFGINPGPIDGLVGPKTEAAVKKFQKAEKLEVDGIVGPKTLAAIDARKKALKDARLKGEASEAATARANAARAAAAKAAAAKAASGRTAAAKAATAKTAAAKAAALKSALAKKTPPPKKAESTVAGTAKAIIEAAKKAADKQK